MELRPFRSLRLSPRLTDRGDLSSWIATPGAGPANAPGDGARNAAFLTVSAPSPEAAEGLAAKLQGWLAEGTLSRERRPALWIERQSRDSDGRTFVVPVLVGLVRLGRAARDVERREELEAGRPLEDWIAPRRALKADFEPCLLLTKAPLASALDTTRSPDFSVVDRNGIRHDAFRITEYAQHVQLQGLVKSAEAALVAGRRLFEAAEAFDSDPAAVKLPGARFKLCAIADEEQVETIGRETGQPFLPVVPPGLFGVALEDPVY